MNLKGKGLIIISIIYNSKYFCIIFPFKFEFSIENAVLMIYMIYVFWQFEK